MSKGSVIIAVVALAAISNEGFAWIHSYLYNPADSTVYFGVDTEYENNYVFRFRNGGSRIERSPAIEEYYFRLAGHDNISGRIYAYMTIEMDVVTSTNSGNSWSEANVPFSNFCAAGENAGECFATGAWQVDDDWIRALFSTTNSWESWDTSYVNINWQKHDNSIWFGKTNGFMWRLPYHGRLGEIHFSSDTGRTWMEYELDGFEDFHINVIYPSVGNEFYWTPPWAVDPWTITCFQNFGEERFEVFNALDYGPYNEINNNPPWDNPKIIPTNRLGELYVLIDSTFSWTPGIKIDVFHIRDYGNEVNRYSYYIEDYQVGVEPEPSYTIPSMFSITAYPNPSNSGFNFDIFGLRSRAVVNVYDLEGRTLYVSEILPITPSLFLRWDAKTNRAISLPTGSYIVSLKSESQFVNKVITIVR